MLCKSDISSETGWWPNTGWICSRMFELVHWENWQRKYRLEVTAYSCNCHGCYVRKLHIMLNNLLICVLQVYKFPHCCISKRLLFLQIWNHLHNITLVPFLWVDFWGCFILVLIFGIIFHNIISLATTKDFSSLSHPLSVFNSFVCIVSSEIIVSSTYLSFFSPWFQLCWVLDYCPSTPDNCKLCLYSDFIWP